MVGKWQTRQTWGLNGSRQTLSGWRVIRPKPIFHHWIQGQTGLCRDIGRQLPLSFIIHHSGLGEEAGELWGDVFPDVTVYFRDIQPSQLKRVVIAGVVDRIAKLQNGCLPFHLHLALGRKWPT